MVTCRYQQMTEREKTDYNHGNTNNAHGNWKTLGPNHSFPVGVAGGPMSLPIAGKSSASLLSLWTSRQKDKARSSHTEFAGRSYGDMKAELYPQTRCVEHLNRGGCTCIYEHMNKLNIYRLTTYNSTSGA